jgi:REP element-mobilizing transposase RayT
MSRNYKIRDQEKLYFVTFTVVNWIDVFIRNEYKQIIIDSLNFCIDHKGLEVCAWCIMTSHVHLILGTSSGKKLEDIIRDMKRHTSKSILKEIEDSPHESRKKWLLWMFEREGKYNSNNHKYQFWQQHSHPIELFNNKIMEQKLDYIHMNPVVAGIVANPEDYVYSSASDYTGRQGVVKLRYIE